MPQLTGTVSQAPKIPDNLYPAKFAGVEENESDKFGDGYRWKFKVTVEDEVIELDKITWSRSMGPKSNNRKFLSAIAGRQIEVGETIDTDDLIGRSCRVMIKNDPEDADAWPKITDILTKG